jgi:hypothetical protein
MFETRKGSAAPASMTFTTGTTMNFTSDVEMSFWSGVTMRFGTNVTMRFIDINNDGYLEPCDFIHVMWPVGYIPPFCTWWEVLDPITGEPIGEIHIDGFYPPDEVHIDDVYPPQLPIPIPIGSVITAVQKITIVDRCQYFTVHWPEEWYPEICTWWEIMDPETREATGYEFHVDWNNESCEFHVDDIIPEPYYPPYPGVYELVARKKITAIKYCDMFEILDPEGFDPADCSWWEIMYQGLPTGLEFHVDFSNHGVFHVDEISQTPLKIPPTYPTVARRKIDVIKPCGWYRAVPPESVPMPCTWWRIKRPNVGDVEFHVDESYQNGTFHIDEVYPTSPIPIGPVYEVEALLKIKDIKDCDWFTVIDPAGFLPTSCSWWNITKPSEWAGVVFHVDGTSGIDRFHIDTIDPLPHGPLPPPWNVTAEETVSPEPWFYKPSHVDYAPSGMPDFDQKQDWWFHPMIGWSHCGPVAVANSLWWLDSEYETIYFGSPIPPPTISDHFGLVTSYNPGVWDDHDPQNMEGLVNNLAFLMDTNGMRTGLGHTGTYVVDTETGLSQYLQQQGVNPYGDCDGDGDVDGDDINIIMVAWMSFPGAGNWDMRADIVAPFNIVDSNDLNAALMNMGKVGMFYEHTEDFPMFPWIEEEIKRCEDVVLNLEWWHDLGGGLWEKWEYDPGGMGGHYVTCAGVNSQDFWLSISDPWWDAAEAGFPGRVIPPIHPPAHPQLHNDTLYVSHDEYLVTPWMAGPPPPGYPGLFWELVGYMQQQGFDPTWHAFIRAAVVTSPIRDVAVTSVTTTKDGCTPVPTVGEGMPVTINVVVENQGGYPETFTVRIYANFMQIYSQSVSLMPKAVTTVSYTWVPTGIAHITYTITGSADSVSGETDLGDNSLAGGTLQVVVPGNINGDGAVDSTDLGMMGGAWGAFIGDPNWNPNADLDDNGVIDSTDLGIMGGHWGEFEP